jgi:glycosyltransferase involved in cell wall biosynthesis
VTALTIGVPTYNDFEGIYFTFQALRLYQDLEDTELLVVDNFGCEHTKHFVEDWAKARYVVDTQAVGTAAAKNAVFREARGEAVLCCDSHVLFAPGTIARLRTYHREHPDSPDLLQGPLVNDDLQTIATHFAPEWRGQMWGIWATDPRGLDPDGAPFEIPMQGMGVFSCRRTAWPGFNPRFRGFGGEEGYIHEKFRRSGGRCLCLPWLRWLHRFGRPAGVPYPLAVEDKLRNHVIGHVELGLDLEPLLEHFLESLPEEQVEALAREALARRRVESAAPPPPSPGESYSYPRPRHVASDHDSTSRRAIVCFIEDDEHLVQQLLALRRSWLHVESPDTDLVVIGPERVLARLPHDLVKIAQRPAADDPVWHGYRFINSIACLNGAGAERLDSYSHLLRTHADTFITPAWNRFYPDVFTWGTGAYAYDSDVTRRIHEIARRYGLIHRGYTNIGATWYGPTEVTRRAAALTEVLTKHLITHEFASDPGRWPGWYRGVAILYAAEIAVNHCAPGGQKSNLLDAPSTSDEPTDSYPHVHCWHTDEKFSKHWFMAGRYRQDDAVHLDIAKVKDYCMAMSFGSLDDIAKTSNGSDAGMACAEGSTQRVFAELHRSKLWDPASLSGPGSTVEETALVRERLEALFRELSIRTLCDAGCGDASWITLITAGLDRYAGFDVVDALILDNLSRHRVTNHFFQAADFTRDVLPRADAILCRDALVHLPFELGLAAVDNFIKSESTYLITTSFPAVAENRNPELGVWRPLNLTAPPYNFPPPVRYLHERPPHSDEPCNSKSLGVWRLADLSTSPNGRQGPGRRRGGPRARRGRTLVPRNRTQARPLVSCICPTFNRPPNYQHLVEEAVESFLRQTYPNKELILLNDCRRQELVCDAPGVRVFNIADRFASLGEKWNAAARLASGDLVAPWPDDDISLPWRLSLSVELIDGADYFNPRCYWFDHRGLHFDHKVGYAHVASMYKRTALEAVGGYPAISFGEDAAVDRRLASLKHVVDPSRGARQLERSEWFFIYRWGVSPVHASSRSDEGFYREVGTMPVEEGRFELAPHWRSDYVADTRLLVADAVAGVQ